MKCTPLYRLALIVALIPTTAFADPAARVTAAVQALRDAPNYTWEDMFGSYGARSGRSELRLNEEHRTARGECDRNGFVVITRFSRDDRPELIGVHAPGRAAVAETDRGFKTTDEIRAALRAPDASTLVDFKGYTLRRRDLLSQASSLCRAQTAEQELTQLVNDTEAFWEEGEYILGRLSAAGVRRTALGRAQPEATMTAVFHIVGGQLRSYIVTTARAPTPPPPGRRTASRPPPLSGKAVRFSEIGTTTVVVPLDAMDRLTR